MAPMYNTYNLYNEPKEATNPILYTRLKKGSLADKQTEF